jgi:ribosomal protein S18 acetylase RimI-like enzyme
MDLRIASPEDWQASRDIRLRALAQDPAAFCSTLEGESALDEEQWRARMLTATTLLAWDGLAVVGTVTLQPDPHEDGGRELVAMWVDPAYRRSGLAGSLVASMVNRAVSVGAHEVALWVAEDNARARSLYERSGFELTGERDVMRPGVDQVRMRKELPGAVGA